MTIENVFILKDGKHTQYNTVKRNAISKALAKEIDLNRQFYHTEKFRFNTNPDANKKYRWKQL